MSKTSRKSVSKAVPTKKPVAKPKRTTAPKKPAILKKKPTAIKKKPTSTTIKKKSTTTRVVKKPVTPKQKTTTTTRKAASSTPNKRTTRARATAATATATKPTTTARPRRAAAAKVDTATVVLPTRMSIRAREKALVIADAFEKDFFAVGVTLTKVGALCFLLLGSLVTLSQLQQLGGADVCLSGACQSAQLNSAFTDATAPVIDAPVPEQQYVVLLADLPPTITERIQLPVDVSSAQDVRAYVTYLTASGQSETTLAVVNRGNNKYELVIDPAVLPNTQYELIASVLHTGTTNRRTYSLGYFSVVARSATEQPAIVDQALTDAPPLATTSTTSVPAVQQVPTTSQPQMIEPPVVQTPTNTIETESEELITQAVDEVEVASTVDPELEPTLRISAPANMSGTAAVTISDTTAYTGVAFYIRKSQGLNSQNIGSLIRGARTFRFDTRQFPNGEYELYAEGRLGTSPQQSNTVEMTISNELTTSRTPTIATNQERELLTVTGELSDVVTATPSDADDEVTLPQTTTVSSEQLIVDRVRAELALDAATLDELFLRYAVAQQSGDPVLLAQAELAINSYREAMIASALADDRDRFIARELDLALGAELSQLQERVRTFEAVRKERTEGDSSIDTDGDGISDFDEVTLYKTDPLRADTDNDGFTDGAEVIRGYNPNDATVEAIMAYESPKTAIGVTVTDKLRVVDVAPEIELSTADKPEVVRATIKGVGLPNSFVTLYIFSTPTIVTVRTEADGSFVYTFSKELEDGEHQVFVALTDNTGAILAQSEPFTFIKRAQAFTPVDAAEVTAGIAPAASADQVAPYRLVLGMSVFALGILLILLGVGLHTNRPEDIIVEQPTI